jgi:hypothetical protein
MKGLIVGSIWCRGWLLRIDATGWEMVVKRLLSAVLTRSGFGTRCLKLFEICHLMLDERHTTILMSVWAVQALSMNLAPSSYMIVPFFSILVIAISNQVM